MLKIGNFQLVTETSYGGLLDWIGLRAGVKLWGKARAFGLQHPDGLLRAGVGYNQFSGHDVMMHVAAVRASNWLSKAFLFVCFDYPFNTLNCARVTVVSNVNNKESINLIRAVGFQEEGRLRKADETGDDQLIFGMLREECRWLKFKDRVMKEIGHG